MDPAAKAEFTAELFETYHGVKIDVEYSVKSEIKVSTNLSQTELPCEKVLPTSLQKEVAPLFPSCVLAFLDEFKPKQKQTKNHMTKVR